MHQFKKNITMLSEINLIAKDIKNFESNLIVPTYSICTLVTDWNLYRQMLESFVDAGFIPDFTEYLYIDNCIKSTTDAYSGINEFLSIVKGKYIIICHQDIIINHARIDQLEKCIVQLNELDPSWALLGNAGGVSIGRVAIRISDSHGEGINTGQLPVKAQSLDENFILIRKDANLGVSKDIKGFHLYGFDLCFLAMIRGYSAYVVDFHLTHLSPGKRDASFFLCRKRILEKYQRKLSKNFFQTTCTTLFLSDNFLLNKFLNLHLISKLFNYLAIRRLLYDIRNR